MAKRIIILEKISEDFLSYRYCLWADVPATRQSYYVNANFASKFKNIGDLEKLDLQNGKVSEFSDIIVVSPKITLPEIQSALIKKWQEFQDFVNSNNPWIRYGTFYDGTTWTVGGVS